MKGRRLQLNVGGPSNVRRWGLGWGRVVCLLALPLVRAVADGVIRKRSERLMRRLGGDGSVDSQNNKKWKQRSKGPTPQRSSDFHMPAMPHTFTHVTHTHINMFFKKFKEV